MKLYIEILIILFIGFLSIVYVLFDRRTRKKNIENYNINDDKGRKGEPDRAIDSTESAIGSPVADSNGLEQPERREFLQEAITSPIRKDSSSTGISKKRNKNLNE